MIVDCRLSIEDCRLSIEDCRLSIVDCPDARLLRGNPQRASARAQSYRSPGAARQRSPAGAAARSRYAGVAGAIVAGRSPEGRRRRGDPAPSSPISGARAGLRDPAALPGCRPERRRRPRELRHDEVAGPVERRGGRVVERRSHAVELSGGSCADRIFRGIAGKPQRRDGNDGPSSPTIISGVSGALASGRIWLLAIAAQQPGDPAEIVARTLAGIGWALAGGTPLSTLDADRAA